MSKIRSALKMIGAGKLVRRAESALPYLLGLPAVVLFLALAIFRAVSGKNVKFVYIYCNRIGHLSAETELFVRRLENGVYDGKNNIYIGLCSDFPVSSRQLLTMYKRKLFILENRFLDRLIRGTWLKRSAFYHVGLVKRNEFNHNEYYEFNNFKPALSFSAAEEAWGRSLLTEMGIKPGDWFVCFHARDNSYLNETDRRNDYRNCDVNTFLPAAEYIAARGGFALRMGAKVEKPLPKDRDPRIIDYAVEGRSDFMDIYLATHCQFFIGSATGFFNVPTGFNVPVVCVNFGPFEYTPFRRGDLYIPKLYFNRKTETLMSFPEILASGLGHTMINTGAKGEIGLVDNTAEEIREVVKEMDLRLAGKFPESAEDQADQNKFRSLFKPEHIYYGSPARIGAQFLRKYLPLLDRGVKAGIDREPALTSI